eukprot:TRINITY_DN658_c0_g1_i1.p1 TRINITY_DN658_c0_g1~~TRINITY_DN658_c0_g1_i1.p1  ORF type:complete len:401 (+),score=196.65 TRINITY_DN658_c0_g1_i1:87-1205(+)
MPGTPAGAEKVASPPVSSPGKRCWMDVSIGGEPVGRMVFELFYREAPRTSENFRALCTGEKGKVPQSDIPMHYKGSSFHRVIPSFMSQGGDFTEGDGTGGWSIYGEKFDDEPFVHKHDSPGLLSMAHCGPNTQCCQFFITSMPCPHLDGKHVVFGRVIKGKGVMRKIEMTPTGRHDVPEVPVVIADCGDLAEGEDDGIVADSSDVFEDFPQDNDPKLSDEEMLKAADLIKGVGNDCFKKGAFPNAVEKYQKALRYLSATVPLQGAEADHKKAVVACNSNMAQCYLKQERWKEAKAATEAALKEDETNAKVLFRHATALFELKDYEGSAVYARKAKEQSPDDKGPQQLLTKLKLKKQAASEKKAAAARAWLGS